METCEEKESDSKLRSLIVRVEVVQIDEQAVDVVDGEVECQDECYRSTETIKTAEREVFDPKIFIVSGVVLHCHPIILVLFVYCQICDIESS